MRALIDSNVILDVALQREPYVVASTKVLSLIEDKKLQGYVSASSFSDLYYIARKDIGCSSALDFLTGIVALCKVATVDESMIQAAFEAVSSQAFKDFEDAIQDCCAIANSLDSIITRNGKDFQQSRLQILTPAQLIALTQGDVTEES